MSYILGGSSENYDCLCLVKIYIKAMYVLHDSAVRVTWVWVYLCRYISPRNNNLKVLQEFCELCTSGHKCNVGLIS